MLHATLLPAKPCRPAPTRALAKRWYGGASTMVQPVVIEALSGTVGAMTALTLTYPLMAVRDEPSRDRARKAQRQSGAQPRI